MLKVNKKIYGFEVKRVRENNEVNGRLWELTHIQTGASLIWLENNEKNKLFSITFKTIPSDNTGVFHILEHSVLGGSKSFPVKEPFVELLKSSMNTFLNAMTFPDKTVFPVSSKNEKDFLNLTKVYLDAVFSPTIYTNPNVFYQEGWHYEIFDHEDIPTYKGIVFNEMKGVYSSPESILSQNLMKLMFPNNCYGYSAGGIPQNIPELTYQNFLETHKKYYHPTNARIYLDGDLDIEKVLKMIDEDYLCHYNHSDDSYVINAQTIKPVKETIDYYEVDEIDESQAYMGIGKIISDQNDSQLCLGYMVLCHYLCATNESPLKKALLSNGYAQDVQMMVEDTTLQPFLMMIIKNINYKDKDEINKTITNTILDLIHEGLDYEKINAIIDSIEYSLKELSEPKGLERNINVLKTWLFDNDPMLGLLHDQDIQFLRQSMNTHFYINLLRNLTFDDETTIKHYLLPSLTKGRELIEAEKIQLIHAKESWDKLKTQEMIDLNYQLVNWQNKLDTLEELNTLPKLSLSDVDEIPDIEEIKVVEEKGVTILKHQCEEKNIVHYYLYFSLATFSIDDFQALSFLTNLLGVIPTQTRSLLDLEKEFGSTFGFIDYDIQCFDSKDKDISLPYFVVSFSSLVAKEKKAFDLIADILSHTLYKEDIAKELILDILHQGKAGMYESIIASGNQFAIKRALSYGSGTDYINELTTGIQFYNYLKDFENHFDERIDDFIAICEKAQRILFDKSHLVVSVTKHNDDSSYLGLIDKLTKTNQPKQTSELIVDLDTIQTKEAIQIPASISYMVSAGHLKDYGVEYHNVYDVLSTILTYDYLWNEVRVKGGAYGCSFKIDSSGSIKFSSYRDPSPKRTLSIYNHTIDYLKKLCEQEEPLDKYIIGTIASQEPLLETRVRSYTGDVNYFRGVTLQDHIRKRKEVLNLNKEILLKLASFIENVEQYNSWCLIGSNEAIEQTCDESWEIIKL